MYAAALPFWYIAGRRLQRALTQRMVPLLSLFAALSFAIMMFNIPLPGGTTGHITGGAIIAAVLGPWAAVLAMSVVLVIQALFFGDGGIMAIGANCFNMAVALPLVSYVVFRLFSARSGTSSSRRAWAAGIGGYVGVSLAALLTALELGVQPLLFSDGGLPLYSPYDLSQTLPAMMLPHLLLVGPLEGLVTGLAIRYLQRSHNAIFNVSDVDTDETAAPTTSRGSWARSRRLWAGIVLLVVLSPLGMLAPGIAW
jgi:cobalt/nickel transport system permease protein